MFAIKNSLRKGGETCLNVLLGLARQPILFQRLAVEAVSEVLLVVLVSYKSDVVVTTNMLRHYNQDRFAVTTNMLCFY